MIKYLNIRKRASLWFEFALNDSYLLLGEIQETCCLAETTVILRYIHLRTMEVFQVLLIKVS